MGTVIRNFHDQPVLSGIECSIVRFPNGGPSFVTTLVFQFLRYNQVQHFHDIWSPNWTRNRATGSSLGACSLSVSRRTRSLFCGARTGQRASGGQSRSSLEDCHRAIRLYITPEHRDLTPRRSFFDVILESRVPANQFARIQLYPPLLILLRFSKARQISVAAVEEACFFLITCSLASG
jgi:hypothetical protein